MLQIADLRAHITSALGDPALQLLLDAAYEAITNIAGASGAVTDMLAGTQGPLLMLNGEASGITSVTEDGVLLDATDYQLRPSGSVLERLRTGPHPRWYWKGRVDVVRTPLATTNGRDVVAIALIRNYLDFHPGASSERIGDWSESFSADTGDAGYAARREEILATLLLDPVGLR